MKARAREQHIPDPVPAALVHGPSPRLLGFPMFVDFLPLILRDTRTLEGFFLACLSLDVLPPVSSSTLTTKYDTTDRTVGWLAMLSLEVLPHVTYPLHLKFSARHVQPSIVFGEGAGEGPTGLCDFWSGLGLLLPVMPFGIWWLLKPKVSTSL